MASEFHTKAMQQCTNIYNGCFEVMHILNLSSVGIMSNGAGICGGYEKTRTLQVLWLNLLRPSENYTKSFVDTVHRTLQWHLSSPVHCERCRASAVNKFNDAHWKRDVWAAAVTGLVTHGSTDSSEATQAEQLTSRLKSCKEGKSNHSVGWQTPLQSVVQDTLKNTVV